MLRYTSDIMKALRDAGFSTYKIQKERILSSSTITKLNAGIGVSWDNLDRICTMLKCQPGNIIEWVPDDEPRDLSD